MNTGWVIFIVVMTALAFSGWALVRALERELESERHIRLVMEEMLMNTKHCLDACERVTREEGRH